jgi:hypothetical protein
MRRWLAGSSTEFLDQPDEVSLRGGAQAWLAADRSCGIERWLLLAREQVVGRDAEPAAELEFERGRGLFSFDARDVLVGDAEFACKLLLGERCVRMRRPTLIRQAPREACQRWAMVSNPATVG